MIPPPALGIPAVVTTDPTCPFPRKLSLEPSLLSAVRYACVCGNSSAFFRPSGAAKVNDGKMARCFRTNCEIFGAAMGGFARFTSIRYLILQTSCFKIIVAICCFTGPQMDPTSYFWAGPEASASVDLSSFPPPWKCQNLRVC